MPRPDSPVVLAAVRRWPSARVLRVGLLAGLMLLLVLRVPVSAVHPGLARDFFVAYRIVLGESFPLYGPVLNDTIHLGPVWFYLLAGLLALGRDWLVTLGLLGLLAAMQVPLAYLLGREVHGRVAGLLFAAGLLVPNWSTFEWLLPSHPMLSIPCNLAALLCAVRYWRRPRMRYYAGAALMFSLAVHAHPSNVSLAWPLIALTLWAWRAGALRLRDLSAAGLLALLPLAPFLLQEWRLGFPDLLGAGAYLGNSRATGSPAAVLQVFAGIAWGGMHDWFATTLGWPRGFALVATGMLASVGAAAAGGLALACRDTQRRRFVVAGVLAFLGVLLTTACIRVDTPYYMAASGSTLLAGLVAIGLASLGEGPAARGMRVFAVAATLAAALICLLGFARLQGRGAWPLGWYPMLDIKKAAAPAEPLPLMPAYAQRRSGRFLCSDDALALHGAYATQLMFDQAVAMRLACARGDVHIGGAAADRHHWLGLSRALLARVGVTPVRRIGPFGLLPAQPVGTAAPIVPPPQPVYPPRMPPASPQTPPLRARLSASGHLAVTNLAYGLGAAPVVSVTLDGRHAEPVARDALTAVYACRGCAAGSQAEVVIEVAAGQYPAVDVVLF